MRYCRNGSMKCDIKKLQNSFGFASILETNENSRRKFRKFQSEHLTYGNG